jgi:hypothetical protein
MSWKECYMCVIHASLIWIRTRTCHHIWWPTSTLVNEGNNGQEVLMGTSSGLVELSMISTLESLSSTVGREVMR